MFARISTFAAVASLASAAQLDAALGTQAKLNVNANLADWGGRENWGPDCCVLSYDEQECIDRDLHAMFLYTAACYGCEDC